MYLLLLLKYKLVNFTYHDLLDPRRDPRHDLRGLRRDLHDLRRHPDPNCDLIEDLLI